MKAVIYDRTSGDEDEGQDVKAQAATTAARARERGFEVVGVADADEDVKGDSDPWTRKGYAWAVSRAQAEGAVLVVREASRVTREAPWIGLERFAELDRRGVRYLSLAESCFDTTDPVPADKEEGTVLHRFIVLWQAWAEKRRAVRRSKEVTDAIHKGHRKTASGKLPHRPRRELIEPGFQAACDVVAEGGSRTDAREAYRKAAGYYEVKDPDARAKRDVGETMLMERVREFHARAGVVPVGKSDPSESGSDPASGAPDARGPLPDQTKRPADERGETRPREEALSSRPEESP